MTTSESVDKIFPAFIKAQAEIGNPKKTKENTFFKAKYAELSDIIDMSKQVLHENGLCLIQSPEGNGQSITVTGRIIHTSGQWIEGAISLTPIKNDPQQAGSAITYARRYQISAMLNIAQEDDDGNASSQPAQKPVTIQTKNPETEKAIKDLTDWINIEPAVFSDVQKLWAEKQIAEKNLNGMKLAITKASDLQKAQKAGA